MAFQPYDPGRKTHIYRRDLPHWQQPGTTYFVTFRLEDSIPAARARVLEQERQDWLLARGIPSVEALADQPEAFRRDYAKTFNAKWHALLDAGYGSCVLRQSQVRVIAVTALCHFHGERLDLDLAVIMPNHVHALITPQPGRMLEDLLHSIKRFSARGINEHLHHKGALWLDENFDHIVRSEAQLQHYRNYIRENPSKARLQEGHYWIGSGESGAGFASG